MIKTKGLPGVLAFSCLLFAAACNSNEDGDTTSTDAAQKAFEGHQCYEYTSGSDTIQLTADIKGDAVTGRLAYHLYQKDKNDGEIAGVVNDGKMIVDYTFSSEGRTSIRQMVFLIKDDLLIEGYGTMKNDGDRSAFTNIDSLKYENGLVLKNTHCSQ